MKHALVLAGLLAASTPMMSVTGCSSQKSETVPATVKTRMVYYAMPG